MSYSAWMEHCLPRLAVAASMHAALGSSILWVIPGTYFAFQVCSNLGPFPFWPMESPKKP